MSDIRYLPLDLSARLGMRLIEVDPDVVDEILRLAEEAYGSEVPVLHAAGE